MRISLLILILTINPFYDSPQKEKYWDNESKLKWSDFRAKPDRTSEHKASTTCEIVCNIEATDTYVLVKLYCFFNREESWTKTYDPFLLNHEQRHFDIYESYARKMRKEIGNILAKDKELVIKDIRSTYEKIFDDCSKMQDQYDRETDHSRNSDMQEKWNIKIDKLIEETKGYDALEISLSLRN